MYIDAEWTSDNSPVSVQVDIKNNNGFQARYMVINKNFEKQLDHYLISLWKTTNQTEFLFYHFGKDTKATL